VAGKEVVIVADEDLPIAISSSRYRAPPATRQRKTKRVLATGSGEAAMAESARFERFEEVAFELRLHSP
jgi:hypothetical protein